LSVSEANEILPALRALPRIFFVSFFFSGLLFKTPTRHQTNKTVCVQWGFSIVKHGGLERLALALDGLRSLRHQVE
jgi:hypothetical protein